MKSASTGTARSRIQIAEKDRRIDALYFRRLWMLIKPYWLRKQAWGSWITLIAVLTATSIGSVLGGLVSIATADQTNALVAKNLNAFWTSCGILIACFLGRTILNNVSLFGVQYLQLYWRRWLSIYLIDKYLSNRTYYDINIDQDVDNPDQRIQEDIEPFCFSIIRIPNMFIGAGFDFMVQVAVLMSISPSMFWATLGFSGVQLYVSLKVYGRQVSYRWDSKIAEADFRYGLLHVRDHAETVAFYRGEAAERQHLMVRVHHAVASKMRIVGFDLKLNWLYAGMDFAWQAMPLLVIAPAYLAGKLEFGAIAQGAMAATILNGAIERITGFIPTLATAAPNAVRLAQIQEKFDTLEERRRTHAAKPGQSSIAVHRGEDGICLNSVSFQTPGGEQSLTENLSFTLPSASRLLIVGQTGVGKSSLLRVIAALWTRGEGSVSTPSLDDALFLPQQPYMMLGSLRSQLLYPGENHLQVSDEELLRVLEQVRLSSLADQHGGLDVEKDWSRILSLGEQQRVAFGRVLLNHPSCVFLDEGTSAVDLATEAHLYALLIESGATIVSVGHRSSLFNFHDTLLELRQDGWSITKINDPSESNAEIILSEQGAPEEV